MQNLNYNLEEFNPEYFQYKIINAAHHGTEVTYRKVLAYLKPEFTLELEA
jgi:hypothetical protein